MEEAKTLIAKQVVHGYLYFPKDFERKLFRGEQAHVSVFCNMSLMLTYKAIYQTALTVSQDINSRIQISGSRNFTNRDDEVTTKPLDFDEVPIFNTTGGYGNAIIPGVLMLILQQTLLLGIGLAAGTARENNRYQDLVPISKHYVGIFRIVLGKALCYFMVYIVMGTYLALAIPRMFGFTSMLTAVNLFGLLIPYILACTFFGMTLSCIVRYRENVMLLVVFTSVPLLFLTGISWPQSNIPGVWQGISWLFPSTFGVRGFLRLSSMGADLSDILTEYQALWLQVVAYFFLTCAVYRSQLKKTRTHATSHIDMIKQKAKEAKRRKAVNTTKI